MIKSLVGFSIVREDKYVFMQRDYAYHKAGYSGTFQGSARSLPINEKRIYPKLAATIIECSDDRSTAAQYVATTVYCSRKEAKRLIYSKTNQDRGVYEQIVRQSKVTRRHFFKLATDLKIAKKYINSELDYYIDIYDRLNIPRDAQFREIRRIKNYLDELGKAMWPILIAQASSTGDHCIYFLAVDRIIAHSLIYADKPKKPISSHKVSGTTVTGRTTSSEGGFGSLWSTDLLDMDDPVGDDADIEEEAPEREVRDSGNTVTSLRKSVQKLRETMSVGQPPEEAQTEGRVCRLGLSDRQEEELEEDWATIVGDRN